MATVELTTENFESVIGGADLALVDVLAQEAVSQWMANFNPRPADAPQFAELYRRAFRDFE